jgi:O-antigen/teichoic acid export membrane protein
VNAAITDPMAQTGPSLSSIASHARLLSLSQVIRRLFRMAILLLAARILGVEALGSYVLMLTVVEMVAIISGYGYMDFLTREIAQRPDSAWPLGRKMTELRLILIVPSLGLALLILAGLHFSSVLVVDAAFLGITLFPRTMTESAQGMMKGAGRFAALPWIELAQGTVVLSSAPILIWHGLGIRGMISAEILGALSAAAISSATVARWLDFRSSAVPTLRPLLRTALVFNVYPFLTNIYDRVDVVLLSRLAGNFAIGIYSLPYRVFATLQIVPYAIMGALLPLLSGQSKRDAVDTCGRAVKILLPAALLLVLATLILAGPAVRFFLGPSYAGSVITIQVLIWAVVPAFINFALNTLLIADGNERVFLRTTAVCAVFNIVGNLLLIPHYSFIATAVVTVMTECLLLAQNLFIVRRAMVVRVLPRETLRIVVAFAAVLATFWFLSRVISQIWAGLLAFSLFLVFAVLTTGEPVWLGTRLHPEQGK